MEQDIFQCLSWSQVAADPSFNEEQCPQCTLKEKKQSFVMVGHDGTSPVHPQTHHNNGGLLGQEGQYVGDGPFLISAVLNGQVEGGLGLFARYQLQTMLRLDVLDGAALTKEKGDE